MDVVQWPRQLRVASPWREKQRDRDVTFTRIFKFFQTLLCDEGLFKELSLVATLRSTPRCKGYTSKVFSELALN